MQLQRILFVLNRLVMQTPRETFKATWFSLVKATQWTKVVCVFSLCQYSGLFFDCHC